MDHPRRAPRDPLKGAQPAAWQSQFRGSPGFLQLRALLVVGLLAVTAGLASAQSVALSGVAGNKALLVVDGAAPRFVAAGQVHKGVRVVSVQGESAVIDRNGQRQTLRVGEAPVSLGQAADSSAGSARVVLTADGKGHFTPQGQINGRAVQFLVDTGASQVVISESEAGRLNIDFAKGVKVRVSTANGNVQGHQVQLDSVRVGDAQLRGVSAIVLPQPMPYVLLGNTFLNRFQMQRTNDQLTLDKRF